jgi:hypothetical protein
MTPTKETAIEVCKILDALAALSYDLACHCDVPPDTLILSAKKTRDACESIQGAVAALKRILQISEDSGNGPIPASLKQQLDCGPK